MGRPFNVKDVKDVGTYKQPDAEQKLAFEKVSLGFQSYCAILLQTCPESPDLSDAIRKLREVRMIANSSIAHRGKY